MTEPPSAYLVSVAEPALDEIEEARAYIEAQGAPAAAERFARRIGEAILSLAQHPHRGRPVGRGLRELTIVPPYVIRYRVRGRSVEVVRIRHGARR